MIYLDLLWTFFKIGLFTFGGGYAMLPLIQSEVVAHHWMKTTDIIHFIAISESTPGPFAVNISTYVGRITAGIGGAFCATLGVILPSFLVILLVVRFYERFRKSRWVEGMMTGLRPAVIGLMTASLLSIGAGVFSPANNTDGQPVAVSVCVFLLMSILALKKAHPILIIGLSAAAGIVTGCVMG